MYLDGARHLSPLSIHIAENKVNLERVGVNPRGLAQLFDRDVDLIGDEEVEAQDVVMRFPCAPAIDPFAVAKLVAFPRLPDRDPGQERKQPDEKWKVVDGYTSSLRQRSCRCTTPSTRP